jgi:hypothetical protein
MLRTVRKVNMAVVLLLNQSSKNANVEELPPAASYRSQKSIILPVKAIPKFHSIKFQNKNQFIERK